MNPKMLRPFVMAISGLVMVSCLQAQTPNINFPAASPPCTLKQRVGLTDIEVVYSRPSMKGRTIFGGIVPYFVVWRTGANQATKLTFSTPVKLEGHEIPAGTYSLFTIPDPRPIGPSSSTRTPTSGALSNTTPMMICCGSR